MNSITNKSLKQRVLHSGSWTLVGHGLNQAIRLAGNLALTRLLYPEAFGLMAICQAVLYGVHMMSDVGIGPSIVQKNLGNDPHFLNTAWSVQIVRGFLVWLGVSVLSFPIAYYYKEPILTSILPCIGLTSFILGFNSTKMYTAQRNLEVSRVTQVEVGSFATGLLVTVFLAWYLRSVWAMVWGGIFTSIIEMSATHILLHGNKNKFAWDADALKHLRGFGRWVMLSSALTFLSVEGARLLIGGVLGMRELALYTLGSTMSLMLWQAIQQLSARVFFPAFAEVYRNTPSNLPATVFKSRWIIIVPCWLLGVFFLFFGTPFMKLLYDVRYQGSGYMLEILATGTMISCVWGSYVNVLLAIGKVGTMAALTAVQVIFQISAIYIGYHFWGEKGVVMAVALVNWLIYPIYAFVMHRSGIWQYKLDLSIFAVSGLLVALAWL